MNTTKQSAEDYFAPSAYEAIEQVTELLSKQAHNVKLSLTNRNILTDFHNDIQLFLSKLESELGLQS